MPQTNIIPKLSPNKNFNREVEMDKTLRKSKGTIELCFDVDSDIETINKENKSLQKSMGTIELCFDTDSDSEIDSDNEIIKKEHYSDEELGSIKVESVMTLKEFKNKIKLKIT